MKKISLSLIAFAFVFQISSCGNKQAENADAPKAPKLKESDVAYSVDSTSMTGFAVYDENIEGKQPAVLVVPEWWGLNDYAKKRARMLAELGYVAMAVDMYGNAQTADNPEAAQKLATPFYMNPVMAKSHFDAALSKLKSMGEVDTTKIAAIGYCFGGGMLLNFARLGETLNGMVSFHGSLLGTPADKSLLKTKLLVLHGEADQFVPSTEVTTFKRQMDSIGADYTFKSYVNATHAFTNPDATANGQKFKIPIAYNAAADTASWKEMKGFLETVFK